MFETSVLIYTENAAVILRSIRTVVSIQYWHVTDRQTDTTILSSSISLLDW